MNAPGTQAPCNIASALPPLAAQAPDRIAMRCPGSRGPDGLARFDVALTYRELDARSDAIAAGLAARGVVRGTRTVVMVRPGPSFFLLMFALFKAGAVPVLVDPGIDRRALRQCLDEAQPEAFIGIPLAHVARVVLGWAKSARIRITTGARAWLSDATLDQVEREGAGAGSQLADTQPDDVAAILFTSGSTGVPKGVVYRHRHFVAQVAMLRDAFGVAPGGVDLPTFPPFALFDPALGLTSVIPDMDPTKPALADPRKLHDAIARFGIDQLFGSPALMAGAGELWRAIADGEARDLRGRAGSGRRGGEDARTAAGRRAVLDSVWRDRMPAGRGDRRPRIAGHARGDRSRRRHLRGSTGGAERGPHHPHHRRADRDVVGRTACRRRRGRRDHRGRAQRDRPVFQSRGADAAGEDP
jgi:non-ribosomal peptide synthetase component F